MGGLIIDFSDRIKTLNKGKNTGPQPYVAPVPVNPAADAGIFERAGAFWNRYNPISEQNLLRVGQQVQQQPKDYSWAATPTRIASGIAGGAAFPIMGPSAALIPAAGNIAAQGMERRQDINLVAPALAGLTAPMGASGFAQSARLGGSLSGLDTLAEQQFGSNVPHIPTKEEIWQGAESTAIGAGAGAGLYGVAKGIGAALKPRAESLPPPNIPPPSGPSEPPLFNRGQATTSTSQFPGGPPPSGPTPTVAIPKVSDTGGWPVNVSKEGTPNTFFSGLPKPFKTLGELIDVIPKTEDAKFNNLVERLRSLNKKGTLSDSELYGYEDLLKSIRAHPSLPEGFGDEWDVLDAKFTKGRKPPSDEPPDDGSGGAPIVKSPEGPIAPTTGGEVIKHPGRVKRHPVTGKIIEPTPSKRFPDKNSLDKAAPVDIRIRWNELAKKRDTEGIDLTPEESSEFFRINRYMDNHPDILNDQSLSKVNEPLKDNVTEFKPTEPQLPPPVTGDPEADFGIDKANRLMNTVNEKSEAIRNRINGLSHPELRQRWNELTKKLENGETLSAPEDYERRLIDRMFDENPDILDNQPLADVNKIPEEGPLDINDVIIDTLDADLRRQSFIEQPPREPIPITPEPEKWTQSIDRYNSLRDKIRDNEATLADLQDFLRLNEQFRDNIDDISQAYGFDRESIEPMLADEGSIVGRLLDEGAFKEEPDVNIDEQMPAVRVPGENDPTLFDIPITPDTVRTQLPQTMQDIIDAYKILNEGLNTKDAAKINEAGRMLKAVDKERLKGMPPEYIDRAREIFEHVQDRIKALRETGKAGQVMGWLKPFIDNESGEFDPGGMWKYIKELTSKGKEKLKVFLEDETGAQDPFDIFKKTKRPDWSDRPPRVSLHGDEVIPEAAFQADEGKATQREWMERFLPKEETGMDVSNPTDRATINKETKIQPEGRMNTIATEHPEIWAEAERIYQETNPEQIVKNFANHSKKSEIAWRKYFEAEDQQRRGNASDVERLSKEFNRANALKELAQSKYERASYRQLEGGVEKEGVKGLIKRLAEDEEGSFDWTFGKVKPEEPRVNIPRTSSTWPGNVSNQQPRVTIPGPGSGAKGVIPKGWFGKKWEQVAKVPREARNLMTSLDLSFPLRQGITNIYKKEFRDAFKAMWESAKSEGAYDKLMHSIENHPRYEQMRKSKLNFAELKQDVALRDEDLRGTWVEKWIPGVRASNRAYTTMGNKLRFDLFNSMVDDAVKSGVKMGDAEYNAIASFVNATTGRSNLRQLERVAKPLNDLFFSPRLMASRISMLRRALDPRTASSQFKGVNPKVAKKLRMEAWKSMLAVASLGATSSALSNIFGDEPSTYDLTSPDLGKFKIGKTRLDFTGGFQQYVRTAFGILNGLTTRERGKTTGDVGGRFLRNKLAPHAGALVDLAYGTDVLGRETRTIPGAARLAAEKAAPLVLQDLVELANEDPYKLPLIIPGFFGASVQSYEGTEGTRNTRRPSRPSRPQRPRRPTRPDR